MKKLTHVMLTVLFCIGLSGCCTYASESSTTDNVQSRSELKTLTVAVENFNRISSNVVGNVYFTQSNVYACKLIGGTRFMDVYDIEVNKGVLELSMKEQQRNRSYSHRISMPKIYITAPSLWSIDIEGVGNVHINQLVQTENLSVDVSGVGNVDIDKLSVNRLDLDVSGVGNVNALVECCSLVADVSGVGNVTLSGHTDKAVIDRSGIGRIHTKKLIIRGK